MTHNIFTFGNTHRKQLNSTAMGTPLACNYANSFMDIHELKLLPSHKLKKFYKDCTNNVFVCKPSLDDITNNTSLSSKKASTTIMV